MQYNVRKMNKVRVFYIGSIISILILTSGITILNNSLVRGLFIGYDIQVTDDNYAFVTHNDGVEIINLHNPDHPVIESTIPISDGAFGCAFDNDILYIAGTSNGLVIANVSDPSNPIKYDETPLTNSAAAISIAYSNFYVYLISMAETLEIFNVFNPAKPSHVKSFSTISSVDYRDIIYEDDIVYIADGHRGAIEIINVSNPYDPNLINTISVPAAITLYKYDNYLFAGCHGYGVKIIDIANVFSPYILGSYLEPDGEAYGVWGDDSHLYVADLQKGTYLLDISNVLNIKKIAHYHNAAPHDIHGNGDIVCLGDQDKRILSFDQDLSPLYEGHMPNFGYELPLLLNIGVLGIYLYDNVWNNPDQEQKLNNINRREKRTKMLKEITVVEHDTT